MKRKLVLVRHSLPAITPDIPAPQWPLSEEGRQRCTPLAAKLAAWQPGVVVTSSEPKAIETGRIVAGLLALPCETAAGLHEHERTRATFTTPERFRAGMAAFFQQPDKLAFGDETANRAHHRFHQAVTASLAKHPRDNVAIVAHGTVMALFVARAAGIDPFSFWQRLGLPAFVVLALPQHTQHVVHHDVDDGGK